MTGMHVLQLGPYPPPEGGISRNMLAIRYALHARGDRCSIIAISKSTRVSGDPDVYHPRSASALIGLLRRLKFDILHLHIGGDITPRVLALTFVCSVFGNKKSVVTLHSGGYPHTEKGISAKRSSIRGFIFRRFKRIIAVNEKIADVFERYGVAEERIKTILPFVLQMPEPNVQIPHELKDFGDRHQPLLVAVGGLERDYDPFMQIKALGEILPDFPTAGLMIIGGGSLRNEVEAAIAATSYPGNIFLAGDVEHAVSLHLINDADIFLRTTLFDGDAISVREALFFGTPVIATDNGMRPKGVHTIEIGDRDGLVASVKLLTGSKRTKGPDIPEDTSNIAMILSVYDQLATPPNF